MDGWRGVKAVLRIAYSNQKIIYSADFGHVHISNKFVLQTLFQYVTKPWWLSWLERQSHDNLSMLKVEGSNLGIAISFFKLTACLIKW